MESYVECNTDFRSFTYVTGDEQSALTASAVYTYSSTDQDVYLNKLQAGTTGKYTFLHIGTSDGKLQKVSQIKLVTIVVSVYTHSSTDQDVNLNKLQACTTGKYTFLHIGTSDGELQKVSQIKLVTIVVSVYTHSSTVGCLLE